MPPAPDHDALVAIYWVIAGLGSLALFVVALKRTEAWGHQQILKVVGPGVKEAVTTAVQAAFDAHEAREKEWRDQERKEWREGLEAMRRELRDLERDLRQQLRQLEQDVLRMQRPALRQADVERLEGVRDMAARMETLEQLISGIRERADQERS